jgi:hypothetical protein
MSLFIVCTSPELLLVMVMILLLHDPMNGARGAEVVVVLRAFAELSFFSLVVAHAEVATNVMIVSDLLKVDAQIAIVA